MHLHGRSFSFNECNVASLRKLVSPGPLPLLGPQATPARGMCVKEPREAQGGGRSGAIKSSTAARVARTAAVLVPLCNRDGVASMLFTVRTSEVSTHKGQVSFPGGHVEPGEGPVEAALRETEEEIGTGLGSMEILGTCQTLPAVTGTLVTPVLAFVEGDVGQRLSDLEVNPAEVDSVFTLSVRELLDPAFRQMDDLGPRGRVPAFTAGPARVWGLTAMIIDGVLRNAVVPVLGGGKTGSETKDSTGATPGDINVSSL